MSVPVVLMSSSDHKLSSGMLFTKGNVAETSGCLNKKLHSTLMILAIRNSLAKIKSVFSWRLLVILALMCNSFVDLDEASRVTQWLNVSKITVILVKIQFTNASFSHSFIKAFTILIHLLLSSETKLVNVNLLLMDLTILFETSSL